MVMNGKARAILDDTLKRFPSLQSEEESIDNTYNIIKNAYLCGGKLLVCGNGGSAADADHIVGELMKGFLLKRPLSAELKAACLREGLEQSEADLLQLGLPAINLSAHAALMTATINDLNGELIFAQQVIGYGKQGDVFLGISTSGNSKNVISAAKTAKALGMKTIGLTGNTGGRMMDLCDEVIRVPEKETYKIQELHLPVYHALCAMLEEEFFGE